MADVDAHILGEHVAPACRDPARLNVVDKTGASYSFVGEALAIAPMHSWPNVGFHDSVYRWTDERGRVAHCTYQEIWFDEYQRAMRSHRK